MLISFEFPFIDLRQFICEDTGLVPRPNWEQAVCDRDFVRNFGPIRRRIHGGLNHIFHESPVCDLSGSIKISEKLNKLNSYSRSFLAFRRLFFDGTAVGKFSIGIATRGEFSANKKEFGEFLSGIMNLKVRVRQSYGDVSCELQGLGRVLPDSYRKCTTSQKYEKPSQPYWVQKIQPIIIATLPPHVIKNPFKGISLSSDPSTCTGKIFYSSIRFGGDTFAMWLIESPNETVLRSMRIAISRIHVQQQAAILALSAISEEKINIQPFTTQSDRFHDFLSTTKKLLAKSSQAISNSPNSAKYREILDVLNIIDPGSYRRTTDLLKNAIQKLHLKPAAAEATIAAIKQILASNHNIGHLHVQKIINQNITISGSTVNNSNFNSSATISGDENYSKSAITSELQELKEFIQKSLNEKYKEDLDKVIKAESLSAQNDSSALSLIQTFGATILEAAKSIKIDTLVDIVQKAATIAGKLIL